MVITSSLGESLVDKILQYYEIVLNINDRRIYIYIYRERERDVSVTHGLMLYTFITHYLMNE